MAFNGPEQLHLRVGSGLLSRKAAISPSVQRSGQLAASKTHIEKLHTSPAKELPSLTSPAPGRQPSLSPAPPGEVGPNPGSLPEPKETLALGCERTRPPARLVHGGPVTS